MRVTVLHNPTAGEDEIRAADLLDAVRAAGHEPAYYAVDDESVFDRVQDPGDVLLAAGGDGTVRKTALRLGRSGAPVAVLPLGTANNIALTLGAPSRLDEVVALLRTGQRVAFDLGTVRLAGREHPFLEGVGVGLFAEAMAVVQQHTPDDLARVIGARAELARDLQLLRTLLPLQRALPCRVEVDGEAIECDALLIQVLNIRSVGPNLLLAPSANVADGLLDVVVATETHRAACSAYLDDRLAGRAGALARLHHRQGSRVRLHWPSPIGHIDDDCLPTGDGTAAPLDLEFALEPGALRFIVP